MSLYDSSKANKPFFSLAFSIKVNQTLKKKRVRNENGFAQMLMQISRQTSSKSPLWKVLYSLSVNADLILLDEPFTNLSRREEEILTEMIMRATNEFNKSVVVATHNVKSIEEYAYDLMIISRGVTLANGTVGFYVRHEFRDFRLKYQVFTASIADQELRKRFTDFL